MSGRTMSVQMVSSGGAGSRATQTLRRATAASGKPTATRVPVRGSLAAGRGAASPSDGREYDAMSQFEVWVHAVPQLIPLMGSLSSSRGSLTRTASPSPGAGCGSASLAWLSRLAGSATTPPEPDQLFGRTTPNFSSLDEADRAQPQVHEAHDLSVESFGVDAVAGDGEVAQVRVRSLEHLCGDDEEIVHDLCDEGARARGVGIHAAAQVGDTDADVAGFVPPDEALTLY